MKRYLLYTLLIICTALVACKGGSSSQSADLPEKFKLLDEDTFKLTETSRDNEFGRNRDKPIIVGTEEYSGPESQRMYLNALLGPNGETLEINRIGSCCEFPSENGYGGKGMLNYYKVEWEGAEKPDTLFLNMYDPGVWLIPKGLTAKKDH